MSIAFVGLIILSIFSFFQNRKLFSFTSRLFIFPVALFFSLAISLFYSSDFTKGLDILLSQIEFLAIPFIFWINQSLVTKRFQDYTQLLINATVIAAFITFIFFLLPIDLTQYIAANVPLLKDYIVHEKALAFGVYSPFTERLQFSYLIGVAIFLQLWVFFERFGSHPSSCPLPIAIETPEGEKDSANLYLSKENSIVSFFRRSKVLKTLGHQKIAGLIKIMVLFITLLILGARGAQLSFLVASITWIIGGYFYFIYPKLLKKVNAFFAYAFLLVGLTFFLIIAPFFAYKKIPAVKVRYDQMRWEIGTFQDGTFKNYEYIHFTSIRRLLSWKNSWRIIQENLILGVGIGDYQMAMDKEYAKDELGFPVNTQSQFLYYWTAAGLISLLIFISLLGYTFFVFFRQQSFALKLLGSSFIVFYSLIFLFDAPLNFQVGAMTFLIIYCLLISKINQQPNNFINSLSS